MLARFLPSLLLAAAASADGVIEEIVCKVNSDIITRSDLLRRYGQPSADVLRDQIDELLLLQRAKELNLNADADVTRRIADIQAQNNLVDTDKLREFIQQQLGLTLEDFRQRLKNQILVSRVVGEEVQRKIVISEPEKKKYYEEHKSEFVRRDEVVLAQIFVPGLTAVSEQSARDLAARGSYAEVASYARGELRPEIEAIVFAQSRGYVTDPIRTRDGFLVLKIQERRQAGQAPFDEVEEQIAQRLAEPRGTAKLRDLLTRLRLNAFLQIRQGYVDSGAAPGKDTAWRDAPQLTPATVTKQELEAQRKKKAVR
jgi:peptidyl-prolyl cis-trans isomerase SurA